AGPRRARARPPRWRRRLQPHHRHHGGDAMTSPHTTTDAPTAPAPFGAELRDVVVRYGRRDEPALDGASVTIRPGTITGLLGRNGAGKTTLAALLAAFRRPSSGQVLVGPAGAMEDPYE